MPGTLTHTTHFVKLCETHYTSSTVQQHVRDHLGDFVAIKPRRRHGWYFSYPSDDKEPFSRLWYQPLYVDEKDGILKRTDRLPEEKARLRARRNPSPRPLVRLKPFHRRSPVVEIEVTVRHLAGPSVRDAATGRNVEVGPEIDEQRAWTEYRRRCPDRRYALSKRRLCKAELRRHGLHDQDPDAGSIQLRREA